MYKIFDAQIYIININNKKFVKIKLNTVYPVY